MTTENTIKKEIEELKKGCGDDYLFGDWELMCGKHIWNTPKEVKKYHLCSKCLRKIKNLKQKIKQQREK